LRTITKLHLIHWLYIDCKTLNLNRGINFFTGGTGAGKSTVIDALQFLLLGNPRGSYFNKAANENSSRTLIEYLCGMKAESGQTKTFKRVGGFTSYIVAEFHDEDKNKKYCLGVVFDVKPTREFEHQFFILDGSLPDHRFIGAGNTPMSIGELIKLYKDKKTLQTYTDKGYRNEIRNRYLGQLKEAFFELFRKSVSFNPTENIKNFILSFICGEDFIDINEMQENIKSLKRLETDLARTRNKISYLADIESIFGSWCTSKEKEHLNKFIIAQAELEAANKLANVLKGEEELLEGEISGLSAKILKAEEQSRKLGEQKEQLIALINSDKDTNLAAQLSSKIQDLKKRKIDLVKRQEEYTRYYRNYARWLEFMFNWIKCSGEDLLEFDEVKTLFTRFENLALEKEGFSTLQEKLHGLFSQFTRLNVESKQEQDRLNADIMKLNQQTEALRCGIKSYPPNVDRLRRTISEKLRLKYGEEIPVYVLADLLSIRDKSWTRAIEGFFRQKFSLVVDPAYCLEAVKIYRQLDRDFYGVEVIDTQKIMTRDFKAESNSLAQEIITDNPYAQAFVNYALGRVIKCENVEQMNQYNVAITRDGMLYRNFSYSRLNPKHCDTQFIGKESINFTIEQNERAVAELVGLLKLAEGRQEVLKGVETLREFSPEDIDSLLERRTDTLSIPEVEAEITWLRGQYDAVASKAHVVQLQEQKRKLDEEIEAAQIAERDLRDKRIHKEARVQAIQEKDFPDAANRQAEKAQHIDNIFDINWVIDKAMPEFKNEYSKRGNPESLRRKFERENEELDSVITDTFQRLVKKRKAFLSKFPDLVWNAFSEDNSEFSDALVQYRELDIPEYEKRVKIQKEKAMLQFKDDFICRLKDNIQDAMTKIEDINRAIKDVDFGKDRYEFVVRPSEKYYSYYKMLTDEMLISPDSLFSQSFEEKYRDDIDDLFSKISDTGANLLDKNTLEQNVKLFTDYRTYLDFEMTVTTGDVTSELSKTMTKNSGGETQNPYYIAFLASFIELYKMKKGLKSINNIRLIMLDEAFSKMGDEHIQNSIRLMKQLGFQVIMAAPDEKIHLIAPEADLTYVFKNENKDNIIIAPFEKDELVEQLAV
jgi:uncharacterized protein YPO0396